MSLVANHARLGEVAQAINHGVSTSKAVMRQALFSLAQSMRSTGGSPLSVRNRKFMLKPFPYSSRTCFGKRPPRVSAAQSAASVNAFGSWASVKALAGSPGLRIRS